MDDPARSAPRPLRAVLAVLALAASMLLAACDDGTGDANEAGADRASPLLYEIAGSAGETQGWLFGTIHALPDGTKWRTRAVEDAIASADMLIVEVAGLTDEAAIAGTFRQLATTPGLPPLSERVVPGLRSRLSEAMEEAGIDEQTTTSTETWAAALMLARAQSDASSANGVDRALLEQFDARDVQELEGARAQLAIFDALPEADQRDLLREVVAGSGELGADPARLRRAWLTGDEAALEQAGETGILADPGLRRALLVERNRAWAGPIIAALESEVRPLVAIGAAHVVGPDGLAAILAREGYELRRVR